MLRQVRILLLSSAIRNPIAKRIGSETESLDSYVFLIFILEIRKWEKSDGLKTNGMWKKKTMKKRNLIRYCKATKENQTEIFSTLIRK